MEHVDMKIAQKNIVIPINRKQMKNVRLRVYPNGDVKISAPTGVSYGWIKEYALSKQEWIIKRLSEFKETSGIEAANVFTNGTTVRLFGRDYYCILKESETNVVRVDENSLMINVPNIENQNAIKKQLEIWLKNKLKEEIETQLNKFYYIVKKYEIKRPDIYIRRMKTLWGSCGAEKKRLTFNFYLYQAAPRLIEYVVLHELIHFIHRNHNKEFYSLLSLYMPDWKERKNYLDHEVMQKVNLI